MKNTVKFMLVAVTMVAFLAACGGAKKEDAPAQDTTKVETPAPQDTTKSDTTASAPAAPAN